MLNPEQKFVVEVVTREDIANAINWQFEIREIETRIDLGDDRLTDEICQAYANALAEIDPSDSSDFQEDQEARAAILALEAMGLSIEEIETPDEGGGDGTGDYETC